jgi:hypothetical protein
MRAYLRTSGGRSRMAVWLFAAATCLLITAEACAENRVALVIGNGQYSAVAQLPNPPRDASTMAKALRDVGFSKVTVINDANREQFVDALHKFRELR